MYLLQKQFLKKILCSSLSSTEAGEFVCAAQLDVKCCAASLISFKHPALGGHAVSQTCGMQMCAGVKQMALSRCWAPATLWGAEALPGAVWSSWCALRSALARGECSTYAGTAWKTTQLRVTSACGTLPCSSPSPLSQTNTFLFQQISSQCAKTTLLQCCMVHAWCQEHICLWVKHGASSNWIKWCIFS